MGMAKGYVFPTCRKCGERKQAGECKPCKTASGKAYYYKREQAYRDHVIKRTMRWANGHFESRHKTRTKYNLKTGIKLHADITELYKAVAGLVQTLAQAKDGQRLHRADQSGVYHDSEQ